MTTKAPNPRYLAVDGDAALRIAKAAPRLLAALQAVDAQLAVVYPQASTRAEVRAAIALAEGKGEPYTSQAWQLTEIEHDRTHTR